MVGISMQKVLQVSFLMLCSFVHAIEVNVSLPDLEKTKDASGQEVFVVEIGELFGIVIEISASGEAVDEVSLPGLNAFDVVGKGEGDSSTMINGKVTSTRTITLQAKSNKLGLHKLGPVEVRSGGKSVTGKEIYCRVGPKSVSASNARNKEQLEGELVIPKSEVYWGEPFDLTVRYIAHEPIYQLQPDIPEQAHFLVKGVQERGSREILRNGKLTRVYEFVVTYLPIKTGVVNIGPMPVHYTVKSKRQRQMGGFDLFFGPQVEQKEATAPAIQMRVRELPKHKKKTSLVGQMTEFVLSVDKPTVQVNDPIKLQVMFSGKGNLDFVEELPLDLPAGCKMYKAKTSMDSIPGGNGVMAKTIEYVLQINKSGQVVIPAQELLYFDPEAAAYKTITSNAVELFLTGDVVEQPKKSIDELAKEANDDGAQKKVNKEPAYIFEHAGSTASALPWWLFVLFMLMPTLLYARSVVGFIDEKIIKRFKKQPKTKEIIEQAVKELSRIVHERKVEQLHQFFIKTMAMLWQLHEQDVTEQVIEQRLSQLGWDEERLKDFVDYLHLCASVHFTKQGVGEQMHEVLLKKSQYWLLLLGKE